MVQIEMDVSGMEDILEEYEEIIDNMPETQKAILLALGEHLVGGLKRKIPTDTNRAQGTVRILEAGEDRAIIAAGGQNGVDYIRPLLHGTKPHAPGSSNPTENKSLVRWARRNDYPGGFHAIYWNIARYGTEAHDFVSEPVKETETEVKPLVKTVLRNRGVFE